MLPKGKRTVGQPVQTATEVATPISRPTGKAMQLHRRVLLKMIESRHMPIRKDLEANLFGGAMGLSDSPYGPRLLDRA